MSILKKFINYLQKDDPLYKCKLYKDKGCAHIDGYTCDFNKCKMRLEYELFILEQELDINSKDRYYKK